MKQECIAVTEKGKCKDKATHRVERNDLSHRTAHYCTRHADPYKCHPADFIITELK